MALAEEDIEQIKSLINSSIAATPEVGNANVRYELDIRERTIRVEEELKHQRELMLNSFTQMERRFEQIDTQLIQTNIQLEQQRQQSEKRFENIDKQFEQQSQESDRRFIEVGKQFELQRNESDKRFAQVDKQLDKQNQAIMDIHQEIKAQMRWSFGVLIGIGGLVIGVIKITS